MKEATGEANVTVITIVLIAIVLAVGTVIVKSVLNNSRRSSCCNSAGGYWHGGRCYATKTKKSDGSYEYGGGLSENDTESSYGQCMNDEEDA